MEPWEIHPSFVHFPIALLLCGVGLDLYAWWSHRQSLAQVATGILLAGVVFGVLTGLAGVLAFYTIPAAHTEQAHGQVLWHLGLAVASVLLFLWVAVVRWREWQMPPTVGVRITALVAVVILGVAGYLGGNVVYHGGMGIEPQILSSDLKERHHRESATAASPDEVAAQKHPGH